MFHQTSEEEYNMKDETLDLNRAIAILKEERAVLALDVLYGKDSYYTKELSEALKIAIDALES